MTPVLALRDVYKSFGSTEALRGATLNVQRGTIHCVLGENGAGKTTLMRIASGEIQPDSGEVMFEGRVERLKSPRDAITRGIGMVHQHFALVPTMTGTENVALSLEGRLDLALAESVLRDLGAATGLVVDPRLRAIEMSVSAQQRLEILKVLARGARTLILDEPTAVLAPSESAELLGWLRRFVNDGGTVVLITHRLAEAEAAGDELTVLRDGVTAGSHPRGEATRDLLVNEMIGGALVPATRRAVGQTREQPVVASLSSVSISRVTGHGLHSVSLQVRSGEIVGVAAIEGAGQKELLRILSGRVLPQAGSCRLPPAIGFIPEDRHREGIIPSFNPVENVALRGLSRQRGAMPWAALRDLTARIVTHFDVRGTSADDSVGTLSGGNQQRLLLGRELLPLPQLVVAENPTRGLDVRSAASVRSALREAGAVGTAVILYSTDLDELLEVADRIIVVRGGQIIDLPPPYTREAVGSAMLGAVAR
ncbi:MAG: ABC transporter ATP-binding protein [Gemmatimonadota bacterium]